MRRPLVLIQVKVGDGFVNLNKTHNMRLIFANQLIELHEALLANDPNSHHGSDTLHKFIWVDNQGI